MSIDMHEYLSVGISQAEVVKHLSRSLRTWVDFYELMVRLNCAANELYHSRTNHYLQGTRAL